MNKHTCQLFENFMGEKARNDHFQRTLYQFLIVAYLFTFINKTARASEVMTISMGVIFENFL